MTDPNALLMGSGGAWAKFEQPGDKVSGEIVAVEARQATDLDGNPRAWDNGDPIMEVVVTLQTDERSDGDDDGIRKVSIGGSMKYASKKKATVDAVRAAGAKGLEAGGTFALAYTGEGEPTKRGYNPPKLFQAAYKAPVAGVDLGDLLGG
jgi:hypothetical protein